MFLFRVNALEWDVASLAERTLPMNRYDLINPPTEEQEAENAVYIASECEKTQATWTEYERQCRSYVRITVFTVPQVSAEVASHIR